MTREEFQRLYALGPDACWKAVNTRISELEGRLKRNSGNSHFPPSTDLGKPKRSDTNNSRVRSGRKPGGQPGHAGTTLPASDSPDKIIELVPERCACGHRFDGNETVVSVECRQVRDLPKPTVETTQYQAPTFQCRHCGQHCSGEFPEGVSAPVQYGQNVRALAISLHVVNFIPYARVAEFFKDWYGIGISVGTLRNIVEGVAQNAQQSVNDIKAGIGNSTVAHFDETGSRCCGNREWDHVASTKTLTFYHHNERRGQIAMDDMGILCLFKGTAVHDHWAAYYTYDCRHSMCCAHLLRDNQGVHDESGWRWPLKMKEVLKNGKAMVDDAKLKGRKGLSKSQLDNFKSRYRKVIAEGRAEMPPPPSAIPGKRGRTAKGKAQCLIDRLDAHIDQILRFMVDFDVPFDNNLAERDIRMDKLKQKVSGGFRSRQGAKDFCDLRSVISTSRKQAVSVMNAIMDLVNGRIPNFQT
jgi:transposase-like protein